MQRISILIVFIFSGSFAWSQSPGINSTRSLFWAAPSFNIKFDERWTLVSDALYRIEISDGDAFQSGIRAGVRYTTSRQWMWTAGPTMFLHYPDPNGNKPRRELRAWQEVSRRWNFGLHNIVAPRVRFEQRFFREYVNGELDENYSFHSLRLRIRLEYFCNFGPKDKQKWSVVVGDEGMFHYRGEGFTAFDQNRAWIGPQYKFTEKFTAQLTYIHILQQQSQTLINQFHVVRLALQFSLDLSPKSDENKQVKVDQSVTSRRENSPGHSFTSDIPDGYVE